MIYILDTANLEDIKHCNEFYPIIGVTTNPSIICRENADFWGLVKEIRAIIGEDKIFFAQTVQKTADKMIEEALLLKEKCGGEFCVKIPICEEGLKATMQLKKMGIKVLVTAIFTPAQALIAAKAGADYVAPYFNRIDNIIGDGARVVADIVKQFKEYSLDCQVVAASFKNAEQVHKCAMAGCHCVTLPTDVLKSLIKHPLTDAAVNIFDSEWDRVYDGKPMWEL